MNHKCLASLLAPFIGILYFFFAAAAHAGIPADHVRSTAEKVLTILHDPQLKSEAKKKERSELLKQTIYPRFFRDGQTVSRSPMAEAECGGTAEIRGAFYRSFGRGLCGHD